MTPTTSDQGEKAALKPCPFCDGEAEIERKGTHRASMQIACTNCGARVESGDVYGLTKPENYKWNWRVSAAAHAKGKGDKP